jgi:hypothetical protein
MTENSRLSAPLRPAPVAVHNNGDVLGQAREIDLREQFGFFGIGFDDFNEIFVHSENGNLITD